ncbi:peptidoglycan DD-metalloendopeptidase family protein [Chloroflexia bacterium SDU3-3]|nr:peptidoglycan DD-metalloendopeptidase family protein [Chloroflexia bacterium SDU3-3]
MERTLDHSPRKRYHARRRAVEARRRSFAILLSVVVGVPLLGWLLWPRPSAQQPLAADLPQAVDQAGTPIAVVQAAPIHGPARYFHDQRLTYEPGFYAPQIQAFLDSQPGTLASFEAPVGGRDHTFAEIVLGQSLYYSVNPKVVLALLESQGQLLTRPKPSAEQLAWAMGYRTPDTKPNEDKLRGLQAQIRYAVRQLLYARRDYADPPSLTFADKKTAPADPGWELGEYALARALAPATTSAKLAERMQAFESTYTALFGDPRPAPEGWPGPAEPFLAWPLQGPERVTSFFDHDGPFLSTNGGTFSYWGENEPTLSYDGHDGWDYAARPPDPALAAADGTVVFAGNADDNCATTAAVIDHGNGYRTLYWHLSEVDVAIGQAVKAGQPIGVIGASGCAQGPHLHFGVQYLGRNTDPYGYCGKLADPWSINVGGILSTWLWKDFPSPCGPPPAGALVVDTDSAGFAKSGAWASVPIGYGGSALYARSLGPPPTSPALPSAAPEATQAITATRVLTATATALPSATASYRPEIPAAGRYRVLAYIPYALNGLDDGVGVTYRIRSSAGEAQVAVDMGLEANAWVDLGTYAFAPGAAEVVLENRSAAGGQSVWADAVIWLPQP